MATLQQAVRRALERTGEPFEVIDCDPALSDTAAFCAHYGYALEDSVNTILVAGRGRSGTIEGGHVACALLGHTRLDTNQTVRKRLGARKVSFAGAEETRALTGMELGGVTVFGLPPSLALWVDARVVARDRLVFGSGARGSKILTAPGALLKLPGVEVVEGLAKEPA
jgi:prolyl-tRNA editing enzyme YbaK/EbsC (Cys-tRNA(Pro) deacylase)